LKVKRIAGCSLIRQCQQANGMNIEGSLRPGGAVMARKVQG